MPCGSGVAVNVRVVTWYIKYLKGVAAIGELYDGFS